MVFLVSWWVNRCYKYCSVVFWEANAECEMAEELASMNSWHRKTTGETIFKQVKEVIHYNLMWNFLSSATSGDGKNMCGTEDDLVGQIHKACENVAFKANIVHFIVHHQVLCRKYLNRSCVIKLIVSISELHSFLWT